ncbi:flavin-containing superfamily Amine oxidase [Marssonina coronariae]|uniref:Flavin-containing superfamily Amine oxidase n=1 Tax=Diplocarpon coronariae TaxID=2795749 RepID=A0A218Z1S7_9HELO|nr:flavin-containing superfamily Amine oxidase [Marssonina coronariae]
MRFTQIASPALALLLCSAAAADETTYVTVSACEEAPESTPGSYPPSYETTSTLDVDVAVIDAESYYTPNGKAINVGVVLFENSTSVRNYFAQLKVNTTFFNPVTDTPAGTPPTKMFDFRLGIPIPVQNASAVQAQNMALLAAAQSYMTNVLMKFPWIDSGYQVPDPVPEELYMPFSDLAKKYNFEPLLPMIAQYNWFTGDIAKIPALYGIKAAGPGLLASFFGKFIMPATFDTRTLYNAAAAYLGDSVLLESTIMDVKRDLPSAGTNTTSVTVLVSQPGQAPKLIRAKKLIVAIPQTLDNIGTYDLTGEEQDVFGKFAGFGYWAGVVTVPGLNNSVRNIGVQTSYQQPSIPGPASIEITGVPEYFTTSVGFNDLNYVEADGPEVVRASLRKLETVAAVPRGSADVATFPYSTDHRTYNLRVPAEEIKNGFYAKVAKLQGHRNTYWTGAAYGFHNSALIWNFNLATIIPGLKKDLGL